MASRFTYDQFQQAAQNSGLLGQFSQADLLKAQQDPDFGMSILTQKQNYANAATDAERAAANRRAEELRASYGNYTGGKDGSGFTLTPLSPGSFTYDKAPTYTGSYDSNINDLWNQQLNYGSFTYGDAPTYTNRYDDTIQELIQDILNREDFSYDPATDPLYQNYRKQYTREGQRATEDALGAASAASGGLPSSYASTAAGQAGNYYAAQMTDKIPELYQLAYNQYLNDYNMQLSDLGVVQGAEQSDYDKYLNQLSQYNTDRNFDYNAWRDQYNMINNNLQTALGMSDSEYNRYLNDLNQYNTDRNFAYNQLLDEIDSQTREREEALNNAILAGQYGDYSYLNDMGINTDNNPTDWERQYNLALLAAEYGDYSGLRALGINPQLNTVSYSTRDSDGGGGDNDNPKDTQFQNVTNYPDDQVEQVINALWVAYPGGVIPNFEWDSLVANGYSAEQLQLAGFQRKSGIPSTPSVSTYQEAANALKSAGKSASGLITSSEWARHKNNGSNDTSGAADFATYADYLQAYTEYLLNN